MNKRVRVQKSVISKAGKIFFSFCLIIITGWGSSCKAGAGETPGLQQKKREAAGKSRVVLCQTIDSIVVYKGRREMQVFHKGKRQKTYIISLGTAPAGKKRMQNDRKTPEGRYTISGKNPNSIYHKNLGISYPNAADRQYALSHRLDPGGDIKIHGLPNNPRYKEEDYLYSDWTWGCIAVSNEEIDELYRYVATGTVIDILP